MGLRREVKKMEIKPEAKVSDILDGHEKRISTIETTIQWCLRAALIISGIRSICKALRK